MAISKIETNSITDDAVTAGKIGSLPEGSVLQVKSTAKTDAFSTTSTSLVDVTGLSVSITPSSASSTILVVAQISMSTDNANFGYIDLVRDSTRICIGDAASTRPGVTAMSYAGAISEGSNQIIPVVFEDSPSTTSSTTYKIQIRCASAGTTLINKSFRDTDNSQFDPRTTSTITVMEIAG